MSIKTINEISSINSSTYSLKDKRSFINYLDTGNIVKNQIDEIISYDDLSELPSRARRIVENGDIIISTVRPNQLHYGVLKNIPENLLVSTGFAVIRVDSQLVDKYYVYYYLTQKHITNFLQKIAEGSTTSYPSIKPSDIGELAIDLPPLEIQRKISKIIRRIEEKLELNQMINNNLSELSSIIHREFIKKMENNNDSIFKDMNKLGNIVMGQSPKGESYNYDNVGLPLINGAADYENGYLKAQKYSSDPKKTANKNDLIFCIRATIGLLVIADKEYCLGRGVAGITNIDQTYKEYSFHLIKSSIEKFKRAATGSVISGISRKDIENIVVKIPSKDEIDEYHSIQKPIFDKIENSRIEINKLTKLRDILLPKLMSGEIDVSDINFDLD